MNIEGKRAKAPRRIIVIVTVGEVRHWLDVARMQNAHYKGETGWRGGLMPDSWSPAILDEELSRADSSPLVGKIGEAALSGYLRQCGIACSSPRADTVARGDGGIDLLSRDEAIQVKTRTRAVDDTLIRFSDERGRKYPFEQEYLVGIEWLGGPTVDLLGYVTRKTALARSPQPTRRGTHSNLVILDSELQPIHRLVQLLKDDLCL